MVFTPDRVEPSDAIRIRADGDTGNVNEMNFHYSE